MTDFALDPVPLLQRLIRFDTTNPPGKTDECIAFLDETIRRAGLTTTILAKSPQSPNLLARLPGRGEAPPLLLYGHVDVVTTANQRWSHPPFSGEIIDGFVWGRGALDMKGGIAMLLSAFLQAKAEGFRPAGDLLFLALSDEERRSENGAKFLVEEHPDLFEGVRYALGEFGGFTLYVGDRTLYPIQVAEKGRCRLKVSFHGPAGHGFQPIRGGAMAKLARFLLQLDRHRLPVHIPPATRMMVEAMAEGIGGVDGWVLRRLLNPALTDAILDLMGGQLHLLEPLLHNTVSPTILHGSEKINVIPAEVSVELDTRLLPGQTPEMVMAELRPLAGEEAEMEVLVSDPTVPPEPDMSLFGMLGDTLRQLDPDGIPVPLLLGGATDGRYLAALGIQSYGFLPMRLPKGFDFSPTIHAADERIPVEALYFGTRAIYKAIRRYGA